VIFDLIKDVHFSDGTGYSADPSGRAV